MSKEARNRALDANCDAQARGLLAVVELVQVFDEAGLLVDPDITTAARQIVAERFERVDRRTLATGRCYERWTETWRRKDGTDATAVDVHAFELLPNGQEHSVRAHGPDIIINCACDSGD